ncbi:MAG TPA: hypothetical protein PKL05_02350 [bacterium]|nr:hypothetical protein [bacterium]
MDRELPDLKKEPDKIGYVISFIFGGTLFGIMVQDGFSPALCALAAAAFMIFGFVAQSLCNRYGDIKISKLNSGSLFFILVGLMFVAMFLALIFDVGGTDGI